MKNLGLLLFLLPLPLHAFNILFYYNSQDGTEGGLSQCVSILQRAGHHVRVIDVHGEPRDPSRDPWDAQDQVWDMRFVDRETEGCGKAIKTSPDYFDEKWRRKAIRYLDHCGRLFLAAEHYQLGNRNEGIYRFLKEIQAVQPNFDECPPSAWGNSSTDGKGFYRVHGLKGASLFYGAYVGGIPSRLLKGTSFGDSADDWEGEDHIRRSFLNGWKGPQLGGSVRVPACGEERLFMVWDATLWTLWQPGAEADYQPSGAIWNEEGWFNYDPGNPPKGNIPEFVKAKTATRDLFTAIAQWLGPKVPCPCAREEQASPGTVSPTGTLDRSQAPSPRPTLPQSQILTGPPKVGASEMPVTLFLSDQPLNLYMRFLDGPGRYRLEIHDPWDAWVKTIYEEQVQLRSEDWATWDGLDASGRVLPSGIYQAELFKDGMVLRRIRIKKISP